MLLIACGFTFAEVFPSRISPPAPSTGCIKTYNPQEHPGKASQSSMFQVRV